MRWRSDDEMGEGSGRNGRREEEKRQTVRYPQDAGSGALVIGQMKKYGRDVCEVGGGGGVEE